MIFETTGQTSLGSALVPFIQTFYLRYLSDVWKILHICVIGMAKTFELSFKNVTVKLSIQTAFLRRGFLTDIKWSWFGSFEKLISYNSI